MLLPTVAPVRPCRRQTFQTKNASDVMVPTTMRVTGSPMLPVTCTAELPSGFRVVVRWLPSREM